MGSKFFTKRILFPILARFSKVYFSSPRNYRYKNIRVKVNPGVFFPHLTISTRLLLAFLEGLDLKEKRFLELGSGTGIISVFAALKGAKVTASDINPKAIENSDQNAKRNNVTIKLIHSDLFDSFDNQKFDIIIINPPYYPKEPKSDEEKAWFCGTEFQYFSQLFNSIFPFITSSSEVYMILSEDCEISKIQALAGENGFLLKEVERRKKWREWNYIFKIQTTGIHHDQPI